jgi:hypothetical protein
MEKTQREAEERLRVHDQFLRETDWAGPGAVDSATSSFLQSGAGAAPKRVAAHSIRTGKHAKGGRQSKSRNKRKRGSARKK